MSSVSRFVTYSDNATTDCSLAPITYAYKLRLTVSVPSFKAEQQTLPAGIDFAAAASATKRKLGTGQVASLFLLTDGNRTAGTDPIVSAQRAANENILIYTITFSGEGRSGWHGPDSGDGKGQHLHASTAANSQLPFSESPKAYPHS